MKLYTIFCSLQKMDLDTLITAISCDISEVGQYLAGKANPEYDDLVVFVDSLDQSYRNDLTGLMIMVIKKGDDIEKINNYPYRMVWTLEDEPSYEEFQLQKAKLESDLNLDTNYELIALTVHRNVKGWIDLDPASIIMFTKERIQLIDGKYVIKPNHSLSELAILALDPKREDVKDIIQHYGLILEEEED